MNDYSILMTGAINVTQGALHGLQPDLSHCRSYKLSLICL